MKMKRSAIVTICLAPLFGSVVLAQSPETSAVFTVRRLPTSHEAQRPSTAQDRKAAEATTAAFQPPSNFVDRPQVEVLPKADGQLLAAALTLEELENMALLSNPSIARAASVLQAARGNWVQVGLAPNPQVGYEGQQIGSGGRAEQDGVFVGQEFVRGGKWQLNRHISQQDIARAAHELKAQRQRVITDVRVLFYQVLIAQQQVQLTEELANIAAQGVEVAESLFKQREVGRVDVLQSKLEVQNANILRQNARNRRLAAWRALATV